MKKSIFYSSIFIVLLSGCSVMLPTKPAYEVSDEEVKKFIEQASRLEQCLYSGKLIKTNEEKNLLHFAANNILFDVVGKVNAQKLFSDPLSLQYFDTKFRKFNNFNDVAPPVVIGKAYSEWCKSVKQSFDLQLKQMRAEMKKREEYLKTPAGQMELARMQQEQQHQEMVALQMQQMAQQETMLRRTQQQMLWQQTNQLMQQTFQSNMQMINQMTPQRVIVTPAYQGPCFGTGPCWRNVY